MGHRLGTTPSTTLARLGAFPRDVFVVGTFDDVATVSGATPRSWTITMKIHHTGQSQGLEEGKPTIKPSSLQVIDNCSSELVTAAVEDESCHKVNENDKD